MAAAQVQSFVDTRLLGKPGHFSGKDHDFADFKFHVIVYGGLIDRRIPIAMKRAAEGTVQVTHSAFFDTTNSTIDEQLRMGNTLFYILAMLCQKKAARIVKTCQEEQNGFEAGDC